MCVVKIRMLRWISNAHHWVINVPVKMSQLIQLKGTKYVAEDQK